MATLYVAEFAGTANVGTPGGGGGLGGQETGTTPIAGTPPIAEQTVAIGGTSAQTSAFSATTRMVRLHTDAICSVAFGASPTASASNMRLAANQTEYFGVSPGTKVAVITNT